MPTKSKTDRVEAVALELLCTRAAAGGSKVTPEHIIGLCFETAEKFVEVAERFRKTGSTDPAPAPKPVATPAPKPDEPASPDEDK